MCNFFSAISKDDKVLFFKVEDIAKIMAEGNPKNYEWNSHTSISHYNNIPAEDEHNWSFWEYNKDKKELILDRGNSDKKEEVKEEIEKYLTGKNIEWLLNFYNWNSGNRNSGYRNSGNWNSGNSNSGNRNSGNWNSGNSNSGNRNSGDWNSGNRNSGNRNSGNWNSGNSNSGDSNSGNRNSGNRNSGDWNSGNRNSGNWNSGNRNSGNSNSGNSNSGNRNSGNSNSGDGVINSFCTKRLYILFNKPCLEKDIQYANNIFSNIPFYLTEWIYSKDMTEKEKEQYPNYNICDGYLKRYDYKIAWKNAFEKLEEEKKLTEIIKKIKKIKNFNAKLFKEITGIKIK